MTRSRPPMEELRTLADAACDGTLSERDAARLEQLLRGSREAQRFYLACVRLDGCLRWEFGCQAQGEEGRPKEEGREATRVSPERPPLPAIRSTLSPLTGLLNGTAAAYVITAIVVAVAIFNAGTWQCRGDRWASNAPSPPCRNNSAAEFVGRITAVADCQWAEAETATKLAETASLGRRYALKSGVLEITYRTGAGIILQGPATFEVDSPNGGILRQGKVTVQVAKKNGFPCFILRTPLATVSGPRTELSEFGVEVNRSGAARAHVFQGGIELQVAGRESGRSQAITVENGQLARVEESGARRTVSVAAGAAQPWLFARRALCPLPAQSSVAATVKEVPPGSPEPRLAVGGDLSVEQRIIPISAWMPDDGQVDATGSHHDLQRPPVPLATTYTFPVTFEIKEMPPDTAALMGRFAAINYVTAIRLNGKTLPGPKQIDPSKLRETGGFLIRNGFVAGTNTLEIDVSNAGPPDTAKKGMFWLHMELAGIRHFGPQGSADADQRDRRQETTIEVR